MNTFHGFWKIPILIFVILTLRVSCIAADTSLMELKDYPVDGGKVDTLDSGNTLPAMMEPEEEAAQYVENAWIQDFEVHFLISLPFTALYSYVTILSLDAMVQGSFPPKLYSADLWMIIGAAVGSSVAIALGSIDRVPDQTQYRIESYFDKQEEKELNLKASFVSLEFVKISY